MSEVNCDDNDIAAEVSFSNTRQEEPLIVRCVRNVTVEIPILVLFFCYSLTESLYSNQVLYRTCTVTLNYDEYNCSLLVAHNESDEIKYLESIIQPYTSEILMAKSLIEGVIPAILSLFIGPWSDTHGRKPLLIVSFVGTLLHYGVWLIYCQLEWLSPWYLLTASIPWALSGGLQPLITGAFCYMSDITTTSNRSARIILLEVALFIGIMCGSISSSYLFNAVGYSYLLIITCVILFLTLLYTIFYIKESLSTAVSGGLSSLFKFKLVTDMVKTSIKPRPNYDRAIIWLCLLACGFNIFMMNGTSTVAYLFARQALQWDLRDYTFFNAYGIVSSIVGLLLSTFLFQKCLKLSDSVMAMISYISDICESLIKCFATIGWEMYLATSVSLLRAASSPLIRSILSKVVPEDDVGKVFSFATSIESLIPLFAPTIYSLVYNATLTTFPGAFYLISVSFTSVCLILQIIMTFLLRNYPHEDDRQPLLIN